MIRKRKYLSENERCNLFDLVQKMDGPCSLFCAILLNTGCRISEALAITPRSFDFECGFVYFETLKRRRSGVFRRVPVSQNLIEKIVQHIEVNKIASDRRIWEWSRMTAYRRVKSAMLRADVAPNTASPKAIRHGFAVAAVERGVPLVLIQRWLGHADWKTTAIYTDIVGEEERRFAKRLWEEHSDEQKECAASELFPKLPDFGDGYQKSVDPRRKSDPRASVGDGCH